MGIGICWLAVGTGRADRDQLGHDRPTAIRIGSPVLADRRPIEVHMSNVFPGLEEYGHNMGYPHPSFVDWDGDGLRDLMVPNITNRVFWYRTLALQVNLGSGPVAR
ncbi:MAG: hypothetical protein CM1200mP2_38430 [Planctomycetaceae bacterium]|nr:MAG: hypothetical protein CM1200mP2_38430 [Planctomycetaceae bacterium]